MKIAYLYDFQAYPPTGGNKVHAYQLIRHFLASGHEVFSLGDDSAKGVVAFERSPAGAREMCQAADVLYVRIDSNRISENSLFREVIETAEIPMVWEVNSPPNEILAFSYLGGPQGRKPWPQEFLVSLKRRLHAWRSLPGIWREDAWRRGVSRKVFGAVCVSRAVGEYARSGLRIDNVRVVPNAADPESHSPDGPTADLPNGGEEVLTVLYAGSPIYPWQGLGILSETMSLCRAHGDPIRFILLMNQPPPFDMEAGNASILVGVPHKDVAAYLRSVDAAVVIHREFFWSKWGSHGSPMKLFDYMACGTPVVASNVGQLAEIIRPLENGILFDNTAEGLRASLLTLYEHRESLAAMGAEARTAIEERHNWRSVAADTADLLRSALDASSGAGRIPSGRG